MRRAYVNIMAYLAWDLLCCTDIDIWCMLMMWHQAFSKMNNVAPFVETLLYSYGICQIHVLGTQVDPGRCIAAVSRSGDYRRAAESYTSPAGRYKTLDVALQLMTALLMHQLCSDGLATDHIVQQLFAHDDASQAQLREGAARHARPTASAASSKQAKQQAGQLGSQHAEAADKLEPAPLLAKPLKPWPHSGSKQWDTIVVVANKASALYAWVKSPDQEAKMSTQYLERVQNPVLYHIAKLLGSLVTGVLTNSVADSVAMSEMQVAHVALSEKLQVFGDRIQQSSQVMHICLQLTPVVAMRPASQHLPKMQGQHVACRQDT